MKALGLIFSTVIVTMLMRYLTLSTSRNADERKMMKSEHFIMKYNKTYGIVGILGIFTSCIFAILSYTGIMKRNTKSDLICHICIVLFFLLPSIFVVVCANNIKIDVSEAKIKSWNLFNKTKEISWDEIKKVECINNGRELKLITDKKSVRVHIHMTGFSAFERRMTKKLDRSIYLEAITKLRVI